MANRKNRPCINCGVLMWDTPIKNITGYCIKCVPRKSKHSPETIAKIVESRKVLWSNPDYIKRHSEGQKRRFANKENHPNWKGGITPKSKLERQGKKYVNFRMDILKRDDFTCQLCLKRGGKLEIDHIKQWALYPDERYNPDNVRTLCHDCHMLTPSYKKVVYDAE